MTALLKVRLRWRVILLLSYLVSCAPLPLEACLNPVAQVPRPLAANDPIFRCFPELGVVGATIVAEDLLPNGLFGRGVVVSTADRRTSFITEMYTTYWALYDRERGLLDIQPTTFALFYALDQAGDGRVDQVYIDRSQLGQCADIQPYWEPLPQSYDMPPFLEALDTGY